MKRRAPSGVEIVQQPPRVEAALWRRLRFEDEGICRETIFNRYRPFARVLALRQLGRRSRSGIELGDMEQMAYAGLLQAIDRYDPLRGASFPSFAKPRILGSMSDGAAQLTELDAQFGYRRRIMAERVRSIGVSGDDAIAALADLAAKLAVGLMLDGTGMIEPADGSCSRPIAYESLAWRELQVMLEREIDSLPEREGLIIRQHYLNGVSFVQIADLLRVSKGRVSQLHSAALRQLAQRLGAHR